MRKFIISVVCFAMALVSLTSCLGDGTTYEFTNDVAITNFSLGTLNRYFHKIKANGTDSIYKRTLNGATYRFNIDHAKGEIWNTDSLPVGVDITKVICNVTTKNSANIGYKSFTSDSLFNYSNKDSIDFSKTRDFYIYNTAGTGYRVYHVNVNMHKEEGDSCVWTEVATANQQIAALTSMKALSLEDNVYVFGVEGETPKVYTSEITDGVNWTELATTVALSADAYKNVLLKNGVFFCLSDGKILTSKDAVNWEEVSEPGLKSLVAATTAHLYGISNEGKMMSSADEGKTWIEDELDTDASFLPTEDLSYACHALRTNDGMEKIVLIGNRSAENYPGDRTSMVWTKIDDCKSATRNYPWNYVTQGSENKYKASRAKNWQIVDYDYPNIKAIRGDVYGSEISTSLSKVYNTSDEGITWLDDDVMKVPSTLAATNDSFAMTADKANSLWIICGGTGQVWKTRINRLVWEKNQDYFE